MDQRKFDKKFSARLILHLTRLETRIVFVEKLRKIVLDRDSQHGETCGSIKKNNF